LRVSMTSSRLNWTMGNAGPAADLMFVFVAWLKNPASMPPAVADRLKKRGLTTADFAQILKSDPFANGPASIDPKRFVQTTTTFPYQPPLSANDPGSTFKFTLSNETGTTSSSTVENSYAVGAAIEGGVDFVKLFTTKFKAESNFTWTGKSVNTSTSGSTEAASVTIGSPSFSYAGPVVLAVYWDTLYNSFLFAPAPDPTVRLTGTVLDNNGKPAAGREVTLRSGGTKRRTFTDAQGNYRFVGAPAGAQPLVEVSGVRKTLTSLAPLPRLDFRLP
jgi:hypothetical protein